MQVKKSLCVLIQHQLVSCSEQSKDVASSRQRGKAMLYTARIEHMLWRARIPRYIHAAKMEFGDIAEVIVEDVIQQGHTLMSQVTYTGYL